MVLNKRERTLAIVVAAAVAVMVGDWFVLEPYLARKAQLNGQTADAQQQLDHDQQLLFNRNRVNAAWKQLLAAGLKTNPSDAENQALHILRDAAQAAHVEVQSLKPDRPARIGDFQPVRVQASGTANSTGIAELLWRVETCGAPMRVQDLRLAAAKEGTDNLTFQMAVTTLAYAPLPKQKPAAAPREAAE